MKFGRVFPQIDTLADRLITIIRSSAPLRCPTWGGLMTPSRAITVLVVYKLELQKLVSFLHLRLHAALVTCLTAVCEVAYLMIESHWGL